MNKKKILIVLLAVLAIIAATVLILIKTGKLKLEKTKPTPAKVDLPLAPKYTKTDYPTGQLPDAFPKGLYLIIQEKDAVILESFKVETESGLQTQYTLKYITKKNISENFEAFRKYFSNNQWAILNQDQKDNFATIRAAKGNDTIIMEHAINSTDGTSIINLTLSRKYTTTTVPNSQLPQGFPKDFPIEENVLILSNINSRTEDSLEATRVFLSKQSVQEKLDFYKKYLNTNRWKTTKEEITSPSQSVVTAIKDNYELFLKIYSIDKPISNGQTVVFVRFYIR